MTPAAVPTSNDILAVTGSLESGGPLFYPWLCVKNDLCQEAMNRKI